jgi:23S rRNA pseudoU1915 N3-methylase RlmH
MACSAGSFAARQSSLDNNNTGESMKTLMFGLLLATLATQDSSAQQAPKPPTETIKTAASHTPEQQEVIDLSKKKWEWMADKQADALDSLFDDKAMFTHMGGTWGKAQELATIKSGGIWYKKAVVYSVDARILGNTAIVLNDIDLVAVVGGNEVVNPFMVTEVYIKEDGKWKMGQLTFSHLARPVKMTTNQ